MAKRWRLEVPSDAVHFDHGHYIWVEQPGDALGARVLTSIELVWDDRPLCFLNDAATLWGIAPWALRQARAAHKPIDLGDWERARAKLAAPIALIEQAALDQDRVASGLLLLRSALRLDKIAHGAATPQLARDCLAKEIERDAQASELSRQAFMAAHPGWTPPAPRTPGAR